MTADPQVGILVVIAKAAQEQALLQALRDGFGSMRTTRQPTLEQLQQALAEARPTVLLCDLESASLSIRRIAGLIQRLKLPTRIVAAAPAVSTRAAIRAMSQGAHDLVSHEDPLHLQLVIARELGMLKDWCEQNAHRLAPYSGDDEGHATLDGLRITGADAAFAGLFGQPLKTLQGTTLLQYVDGDDHHAVKQMVAQAAQGVDMTDPLAVQLVRPDGSRGRLALSLRAAFQDDQVRLMLTASALKAPSASADVAPASRIDPAVTQRIQNALKKNQLSLVSQPISELVGEPEKPTCAKLDIYVMLKDEAGELPASKFILEARTSGLIRLVDRWVVHHACKALRHNLKQQGRVLLFLRLSRQSLHDPTLVHTLKQEVSAHGLSPSNLSFELFESDIVELNDSERKVLQDIKDAGFLLSISRFGLAAGSVELLRQLPADFVKLDPKLAEKAEHSDSTRKLVQTLVQAANNGHIGVIATQVPSATVMAVLWNLGVHYVQGNYLQEPEIVLQG